MITKVFTDKDDLAPAAEIVKKGGFCAVPTETVYGLCVNGLDAGAVAALYELKGRPEVKPLSLMVPGADAMEMYAREIPPQAYTLAAKFWPGPLTIVLKARDNIPAITLAGGSTVGLRCPDHPMTLALLRQAGIPLAGPSANPSGKPSPKTASEVLGYFDGQIDALLDGGACGIGKESTILDLTVTPYRVLRQGALAEDAIDDALITGMKVIGLTGGSGSGKTTAMRYLVERGALGIDCDEVYHDLLRECAPLLAEIKARFPAAFPGGSFDRKALGRIVFADSAALLDLNAITHRYVYDAVMQRLRACARAGGTLAAIDAVELIQGGLGELCTLTVGVVADRKVRASRIMAREGISEEYALSRIDAQKSDEYYEQHCDCVIRNDGDRDELKARCRELFGI